MAEKRMFSKHVIDSDAFLDMPLSTQALYFHLAMRADDDGFIDNPKKIQRVIGASDDDLKILLGKRYILTFESGVIVIKHWRMHNTIRKDRYTETNYIEEKSLLEVKKNGSYTENSRFKEIGNQTATTLQPNDNQLETQYRIEKNREEEVSIDKNSNIARPVETEELKKPSKHKYGEYRHVLLKDEEFQKLQDEYENYKELITYLDEYIEMKGYKAKNHYLCIKKWVVNAVSEKKAKNQSSSNPALDLMKEGYFDEE